MVFGANPQAMEATVKMATPSANTRRRPKRSPAEPPARISAPSNQHVSVGDPLRPCNGRGQIRLNGRQGDSDHGAVDESHARAQDGCGQNPWPGALAVHVVDDDAARRCGVGAYCSSPNLLSRATKRASVRKSA